MNFDSTETEYRQNLCRSSIERETVSTESASIKYRKRNCIYRICVDQVSKEKLYRQNLCRSSIERETASTESVSIKYRKRNCINRICVDQVSKEKLYLQNMCRSSIERETVSTEYVSINYRKRNCIDRICVKSKFGSITKCILYIYHQYIHILSYIHIYSYLTMILKCDHTYLICVSTVTQLPFLRGCLSMHRSMPMTQAMFEIVAVL